MIYGHFVPFPAFSTEMILLQFLDYSPKKNILGGKNLRPTPKFTINIHDYQKWLFHWRLYK